MKLLPIRFAIAFGDFTVLDVDLLRPPDKDEDDESISTSSITFGFASGEPPVELESTLTPLEDEDAASDEDDYAEKAPYNRSRARRGR